MPKLLSTIKRFIGDSTEGKATDCPNGSTFLELDTGIMQIFRDGSWVPKDLPILIRTEYLLKELLNEAKKTNENLELLAEAVKN